MCAGTHRELPAAGTDGVQDWVGIWVLERHIHTPTQGVHKVWSLLMKPTYNIQESQSYLLLYIENITKCQGI